MALNFLSIILFALVQVLFIPLAILGCALVAYKQILVSRKLGASGTAIEVLNGRWTMHVFGMRSDGPTTDLAKALPNSSTLGLWLCLFPLYLKYKISGKRFGYPRIPPEGKEGVADIVVARTIYFDRIIGRVLGHVEQFVLLGAGYDTRAYGRLRRHELAFFELDEAMTQKVKLAALKEAGIETAHVAFVEVDFSQEQWYEELESAGYDSSKKTLFLWEGVSLYLKEEDVRKTLRDIRTCSAPGSVLLADIYAESFVSGDYTPSLKPLMKALKLTDEELAFGLPFATAWEDNLTRFLASEQSHVGETYFMGRSAKKGPYMVVAEIKTVS